jgi:hypothetical protein
LRTGHDLAKLRLRRVALDGEGHPDVGESVADLIGDPERAANVHVAFERRLDRREAHLARRRDIHQ